MTDDAPLPPLNRMTPEEQIRQQTEGLDDMPGFVVIEPGPRAWYRDEHGQWRQEGEEPTRKDEEQT